MAEDIKKNPEELTEEELGFVAGGANTPRQWRCKYCGVVLTVSTAKECTDHYVNDCTSSPYR